MAKDFSYEIIEEIAELGKPTPSGWGKVLTVTKFGENPAKLDIRSWNEDFTRMGKGISLSNEEASNLFFALGEFLLSEDEVTEGDVIDLVKE
mgnify:CR=1 FL=1